MSAAVNRFVLSCCLIVVVVRRERGEQDNRTDFMEKLQERGVRVERRCDLLLLCFVVCSRLLGCALHSSVVAAADMKRCRCAVGSDLSVGDMMWVARHLETRVNNSIAAISVSVSAFSYCVICNRRSTC